MTTRTQFSGFTLLELLIAMALSAMVMLTLAIGMSIVLQEWERSSQRLDDSLETVLALLQIERALEGAFPHVYLNRSENKRYVYFEGDENSLTWVSTVSPGHQTGLMAWQLTPGDEKQGLNVRLVPAFASNPTENLEKAEPTVLFEGYKAYFEYLYIDPQFKNDTKWLKKWSGEKLLSLPSAIRLKLERVADSHDQGLEIVAMISAHEHETLTPVKP